MKLKNLLIIAVLSALTFTSCRDNNRDVDNDQIELDRRATERDAEMRANEQRMEMERNSVTARIDENENLNTFSEALNRNEVSQNLRQERTTGSVQANAQGATTTTTEAQRTTEIQRSGQGGTASTNQSSTQTQTNTQGQNAQGQNMQSQGQLTSQGQRTYTIFAPSDDAFENLSEAEKNQMMDTQNRDRTTASLYYLMVDERLTEERLRQQIQNANGTYNIRTMQGENIIATMDGNEIVLRDAAGNEARIIETDSQASDGVVFVIDRVLMPQDPSKNEAANRMNNTTTGTGTNRTNTSS